jgi:hypothetical protein
MAILFLDSNKIGVNFNDHFRNEMSLTHDYINPLINPAEVASISTFIHTYPQQFGSFFQSGKFGIRFLLTNGIYADWIYDTKDELSSDFCRIKKILCN